MPKLRYADKRLGEEKLAVIDRANRILEEYEKQGFVLTLRQLYYQFVARDLIPNRQSEYKKLGTVISEGRMNGLIDWDHLEDRTRNLKDLAHWDSPADVVEAVSKQFRLPKWDDQADYIEVWIEKDALVGVIEPTCRRLDVAYFSCRGYTSLSEMWTASQRLMDKIEDGKRVTILHLGDHDPSGIDMTRDIEDRLTTFLANDHYRLTDYDISGEQAFTWVREWFELERLALNFEQVTQYGPPPNPAKVTDSRAAGYIRIHGRQSWELDALEPSVIAALIEDAVEERRDLDKWKEAVEREREHKATLKVASERWEEVREFLNGDQP